MALILLALVGLLPILAWNWKSLAVLALLPAGLTGLVTLLVQRELNDPSNDPGFGAAILLGALLVVLALLTALTLSRATGLWLQAKGWRRAGVLWLDALGIFLAAGALMAPSLYHTHITLRPPPASCTSLPVALAGTGFVVPLSPAATIYPVNPGEAAYLHHPGHQRRACRMTGNGTRPLTGSAISIRSGEYRICRAAPIADLAFARAGCATDPWQRGGMTLFDPALADQGFFRFDRRHPEDSWADGNARCRPAGDNRASCSATLRLGPGLHVFWDFQAVPGRESDAYATSRKTVLATVDQLSG